MIDQKTCVDFSQNDLELIESALQTQEKILSVQSRASGSNTAKLRLIELRAVLRVVRNKTGKVQQTPCRRVGGITGFARALFG
jgi:hypothetical protein